MTGRLLNVLLVASVASSAAAAEKGVSKVLTSVKDNVHVDEWNYGGSSADGQAQFSIKKYILHGGKQEGVDVIEVDNGRLSFVVIPTRGMNVLHVTQGDLRLGWDSPVKEVVHPSFINLQARSGLGWLDGFNEWMVRCGLEFAGHPGEDKFINNVGDEATMELTLHGKIGNIPASEVEVIVESRPPHRIRVRGRVDERSFYGARLELWSEISTEPGTSQWRIDDVVTNRGGGDQEFQVIYHGNYGRPLLEAGAKVVAAAKHVAPMNENAAAGINTYGTYAAPTKGFIEQVYLIEPYADSAGSTMVLLQNAAGDRGTSIRWPIEQLPYLTIWKNTASKLDGYVTGLEPATGFPFNRRVERKFGRVPKLGPGQQRKFTLDFALHADKNAVSGAAAAIAKISGGRKTSVDRSPPKIKD